LIDWAGNTPFRANLRTVTHVTFECDNQRCRCACPAVP
jgi:hypothetical protein